jgi:hypothetical protein
MGAGSERDLFDADGTQEPHPAMTFNDPLSGPATGEAREDEAQRLRIAEPVQPDAEAVRRMVDAAMLAERAGTEPAESAADQPEQDPESAAPVQPGQAGPQPLGMLVPQQRTWPRRPPQLLRRAWLPRQRAAASAMPPLPRAGRNRRRAASPRTRASNGSAGVAVAIALMVAFAIVAIQMVSSLFDTISAVFR